MDWILAKPFRRIDPSDIAKLVAEAYPEGDDLEFKEMLPGRDGKADAWHEGSTSLGDRARNEILSEVIAFANAHGGVVVLGIQETIDSPKRAAAIRPIPRCAELADRLQLQARDCIEPRLPVVEIEGVTTDAHGGGIVMIRVPHSIFTGISGTRRERIPRFRWSWCFRHNSQPERD